jgi:hypothetical protein
MVAGHKVIVPLTVQEILDGQIAKKTGMKILNNSFWQIFVYEF